MTEIKRDESNLEQRLKDHYQHRYEQQPDPKAIWAHILPHLDQQESRQPSLLQQAQWFPGFIGRQAARQNAALKEKYEEYTFMDEEIRIDQAKAHDPHLASSKQPLRRRIQHLVEAGIAAILVASLLLGWFALTRTHPSQGKPAPIFTYTYQPTQPGNGGLNFQWMPDGKHAAIVASNFATNSYRYLVWNAATGKATQTFAISLPLDTSTGPGGHIMVSSDGRYSVIQIYDAAKQLGTLKLLNILTGHIELIYQGHYANAFFPAAAFSNDSKYVAFVSDDGHIHFWDVAAGKIVLTSDPTGVSQIQQLQWLDDNKHIIAFSFPGATDKPIVLQEWSTQTGHKIANVVETPTMSLMYSSIDFSGFSPDGQRILTFNTQAGTFEIRESSTLKILQTFHVQLREDSTSLSGSNSNVYISPVWLGNGERIFLAKDKQAYIWNSTTGQLVATYSLVGVPESAPEIWAARSGEGPYIALWQRGKPFVVRNVVTNAKVSTIDLTMSPSGGYWSEHGKYLYLLFNRDTQGQIYDTVSGRLIAPYQGNFAELSSDEKYIAVEKDQVDLKTGHTLKSTVEVLPVH